MLVRRGRPPRTRRLHLAATVHVGLDLAVRDEGVGGGGGAAARWLCALPAQRRHTIFENVIFWSKALRFLRCGVAVLVRGAAAAAAAVAVAVRAVLRRRFVYMAGVVAITTVATRGRRLVMIARAGARS